MIGTRRAVLRPHLRGGNVQKTALNVRVGNIQPADANYPAHLRRRIAQPACGGNQSVSRQRVAEAQQKTEPNVVPPIVHNVLRSPGRPLDSAIRTLMESRFGQDFSHVRVHTDGRAAASARRVNSLAYTVGHNVVFDSGAYKPGTSTGRTLIAHELTHVLQQSNQSTLTPGRLLIGPRNDAAERQADRIATQVLTSSGVPWAGSRISAPKMVPKRIQREPTFSSECAAFHRCELQDALANAYQMVQAVLSELPSIAQGATTSGRIVDLLNVHFHTGSANNARQILENFKGIQSELDASIQYVCHSDAPPECEGFTGGFTACASGRDVHLCAPFFTSLTCKQQARAIIHEMAHHISGFSCRNETYVGQPAYMTLQPDRALRNPDTYAQFATMVFRGVIRCRDCAFETQQTHDEP